MEILGVTCFFNMFLPTHVQFLIHQFLSTNSVNHLGLRMIWVCLKNAGYPIHGHFDNLMIDHASDLEGRNFETAFLWHFLCGDAGSKLEVLLIMTAKMAALRFQQLDTTCSKFNPTGSEMSFN